MILSCFSCLRDVVASGATHHCCSCCCSFFPFELWFTLELVSKPIPNCKCVITNCKPLTICTEHIDFATKCFSQRRRWATFEIWYNWENNKAVHSTESTHTQMHIHMYTSNKTIKSTLRLSNLQWIHIWHGCLQICVHECVIVLHFQPVKHYEFAICLQHCGAERKRENNKKPNISPIWVAQ